MHSHWLNFVALTMLGLVAGTVETMFACDNDKKLGGSAQLSFEPTSAAGKAQDAVKRSLVFLERDAVKWRKEVSNCATCHHGVMTVWVLSEAKQQGYAVNAESLAETARWTKGRFVAPILDRQQRPNAIIGVALLELMAQNVPKQDAVSADERHQNVGNIVRQQEADGSWYVKGVSRNGPPPVFESREDLTILAYLALKPYLSGDVKTPSVVRDSWKKADAWLNDAKPRDTTQNTAFRLLAEVRMNKSPERIQAGIDLQLTRQQADGGWGQAKDLPSDAFATGQALYMLSLAGVRSDRREIQRAVAYLVSRQKEDGSWPMTSIADPGVKDLPNLMPIIYFGSAWATLGLLRTELPQVEERRD